MFFWLFSYVTQQLLFYTQSKQRRLAFSAISCVFTHSGGCPQNFTTRFTSKAKQYRHSPRKSYFAHACFDSIAIRAVTVVCTGTVGDCCAFGSGGGRTDRCVSHARQLGSNYPLCRTYTPRIFKCIFSVLTHVFRTWSELCSHARWQFPCKFGVVYLSHIFLSTINVRSG